VADHVPTRRSARIRKRLFYPYGRSVKEVGSKGALPVCQACSHRIGRDSKRFVLKEVINVDKKWSKSTSFHLATSCITAMALEYQAQARELLAAENTSDE
jgi:hypothetical protein